MGGEEQDQEHAPGTRESSEVVTVEDAMAVADAAIAAAVQATERSTSGGLQAVADSVRNVREILARHAEAAGTTSRSTPEGRTPASDATTAAADGSMGDASAGLSGAVAAAVEDTAKAIRNGLDSNAQAMRQANTSVAEALAKTHNAVAAIQTQMIGNKPV
ncbi:MAG: hypothetical protein AAGF11_29200 [Myxococcota bacterium]